MENSSRLIRIVLVACVAVGVRILCAFDFSGDLAKNVADSSVESSKLADFGVKSMLDSSLETHKIAESSKDSNKNPNQNSAFGLKLSDLKNLPKIEVGDLIFREGVGIEGFIIKQVGKHKFTHIGIVESTNPIRILHASADDGINSENNKVEIVEFGEFLRLSKNIAIKRLNLPAADKNAIVANLKSKIGEKFILSTEAENLYCTTFLEREIGRFITLDLSYTHIGLLGGAYLFPREFYEDKNSLLVYESEF